MSSVPCPTPGENQVVVQFEGICVNFLRDFSPALPAAHRVVLINASEITEVWTETIQEHIAGFSLTGTFQNPTALTGATLAITNALPTGLTYCDSFQNVPTLSGQNGFVPTLGAASQAVLFGHNPMLASCYFDFNDGEVSALVTPTGAIYTQVTITTDGSPAQLQVTPFPTGLSSTHPTLPEPISVPVGSTIYVWNEEESGGSTFDFLLSYLTAAFPPINQPPVPTTPINHPSVPHISRKLLQHLFENPGCSNSQYP